MAKSNEQKERGGLIFELENLALHARRIRYEVLAGIFNEQQIAFSEVEFSRYCLGRPDDYLPNLLEKVGYTSAPATMVAERLRGETLSRLMQKNATIDPTLRLWLDEAKKRGMPIAAVTSLPQEAADSVAAHLAFENWGIRVFAATDPKGFYSPASWGHAAHAISRRASHCVAIVTGAAWGLAALAAGCKVIAAPDEFTAFENFSGMDYVPASLKDLKPDATFRKLSL